MDREKRAKIIIAGVILTCLVIPIAYLIYDYQGMFADDIQPNIPSIQFTMDENNRTLTVKTVERPGLNWTSFKIVSGNATLPSGIIKPGDVITNCSGKVLLIWLPTNSIINNWDFK